MLQWCHRSVTVVYNEGIRCFLLRYENRVDSHRRGTVSYTMVMVIVMVIMIVMMIVMVIVTVMFSLPPWARGALLQAWHSKLQHPTTQRQHRDTVISSILFMSLLLSPPLPCRCLREKHPGVIIGHTDPCGAALHRWYTAVTLLSHCCYIVITLLLNCCYTVVTLMLQCRYTALPLM
jgi:hypothetical protein